MALRRRQRDNQPPERPTPGGSGRRREDGSRFRVWTAIDRGELVIGVRPAFHVETGLAAGVDLVIDQASVRPLLSAVADRDVTPLNRRLVESISTIDLAATCSGQDPFVSVAVDGRFIADDNFLPLIKEAVRAADLEASQLLLTVDASPGFEARWSKIQRLKSHGVKVAVDGFSLGSSATDVLRRYPVDVVRFVLSSIVVEPDLAGDSPPDPALLAGTVKLAHNLGCRVLAEGVRTEGDVGLAKEASVDLMIGPAMPPGTP